MADSFTIEMVVQGIPDRLRQQYEDEAKCDTALAQLKAASGFVPFGGWEVNANHIVTCRKAIIRVRIQT
jgi:hypothetical protein